MSDTYYSLASDFFGKNFPGSLIDIYSSDKEVLSKSIIADYVDYKGPEASLRLRAYYILQTVVSVLGINYDESECAFDFLIDTNPDPCSKQVSERAEVVVLAKTLEGVQVIYKDTYHESVLHISAEEEFSVFCEDVFDLCCSTLTEEGYDDNDEDTNEETEVSERSEDVPSYEEYLLEEIPR